MKRYRQSGSRTNRMHSVLRDACKELAECVRKINILSGTGQRTHRLAILLDIAAKCDAKAPQYVSVALTILAHH